MLRDLAPILAAPVTSIFNASLRDGYVPQAWKSAYITPLPKKTPPQKIESDLRPVSLTSLLAKELERIIAPWVKKSQRGPYRGPAVWKRARCIDYPHVGKDARYLA